MPSRVKPITAGSLPSPSLRVGITGARDLPQDQLSRIQFQLDKVIALTRVCAEEALASHATNSHSTKEPAIRMRFLSPLALGADRIAAVAALQHKYELCVPMPFPVNEYEQDFRTSSSVRNEGGRQETNLEEFRRLKKQAKERIELDGSREGNMTSLSYLAVGRYVVHHSDLLIAVWDGSLGNGTGGTADIVRLASNSSIPICWIHSTKERDPVLIEDLQGLRSALAGDMNFKPAWQGISRYVKSALTAAKTATPPSHRSASKSRSWLVRSDKKDFLLEFLSESLPMPRPRIWNAHKLLMMWAAGGHAGRKPDLVPSDAIGRYWHGHYECGDRLANEYAARYRSTYTWIILLTTLTLCFAAVSCGLQALNITDLEWLSRVVAILELVSLFIIVGLVVGSRRLGWHRKSVEYRLMAELCRKQRMLGR